jgi:hypothetical protein
MVSGAVLPESPARAIYWLMEICGANGLPALLFAGPVPCIELVRNTGDERQLRAFGRDNQFDL